MSVSYAANGNISSKTGIGTYTYGSSHPHAVAQVANTSGLVPTATQTILYNGFGKIETIEDNGYNMDFTYGPDHQRWKTVLDNNGSTTRTTLYANDYERVTEGGVTRHFYFLDGGAVYVKQSGQSDKVYYICADNLGSILKLVDTNGASVFEATYDAWGKQTVTKNTIGFHRGYTGHEMMPEFGLINMNGRLYDPVLGRFLSPDNYVQLPDFSQNFNRYSYCLNNPLKFTDPSGEIAWFIPVIAGAVIGAYTGASIQSGTAAFWNWKSDAWKGAITGAIVGGTLGYSFASAIGASGMTDLVLVSGNTFVESTTKIAGITSSIMNSGTIEIGINAVFNGGWDGAWKAGVTGMALGAWASSGGLGMVRAWGSANKIKQLAGKLGYQVIGTTLKSLGSNWSSGENLLSKITLGIGPINFTFGKGQRLLQWENNIGNILMHSFGLLNTIGGGKIIIDKINLSINYKGGLIDKLFNPERLSSGFSPHVITGNSNLEEVYTHELHHLWQSRSFNDSFLLNYGLQGINALLLKGNFFEKYNYYEDFINQFNNKWW